MFLISAENTVDNTEMFLLFLSSALHSIKVFSTSHTTPPVSRLGVNKNLGGDTAGTANPNRPKRYSIWYDIMLSIESWRKKEEEGTFGVIAFVFSSMSFLEMAEHCLLLGSDEWILHFALLVCVSFPLLTKLSLSQTMVFFTFTLLILFPYPAVGGVRKWLCESWLPAGVKVWQCIIL